MNRPALADRTKITIWYITNITKVILDNIYSQKNEDNLKINF